MCRSKLNLLFLFGWIVLHLIMTFSQVEASLDYKGMTYVSWTRGEYPLTTSWKHQTYWDSQAITAVSITTNNSYTGKGSLEMEVALVGHHPNKSNGEAYVDLRYHPPLSEPPCCMTTPVDFCGVTITAWVYCPKGSSGDPSKPNGIQLFVKDEEWRSFYGNWHNIQEGQWNEVTVTPSITAPPWGHMDPEFDCTKIVMMGVKVGVGTCSTATFSGKMWLDDVTWSISGCNYGYDFENIENSLDTLKNTNANYVALIVTWYMDNKYSTEIKCDEYKTHTDSEVIDTINQIHNRGMSVMLKPHVDVQDGSWRGEIDPSDKDDWFESYNNFITHYAQIAQENGVELFCIGTEFKSLSGETYRSYWDTIINNIKDIYKGPLTYAANWDEDITVDEVSFWDRLDLAGIDAYYPISNERDPSLEELVNGWTDYCFPDCSPDDSPDCCHNWVEEIETWQSSINKPIIFTEIGYRSIDYAAQRPWDSDRIEPPNCELQARCYEAAIDVFKDKDWFKGMFWWNWLTVSDAGGCCDTDFTPQNKPAEDILTAKYGPIPDIKANGSDGPVYLAPNDNLSVTVGLNPGSHSGENADWWVVADTPFGWYHYNVYSWIPGFSVTYQGPLFDLTPVEVLNTTGLPVGTYTFYFGVDMVMNGSLDMDQIYYDSVEVNIE